MRRFMLPIGLVFLLLFASNHPLFARPGKKIKLQVRETAIRDVLMVLARTAKVNILVSKSVKGKCSLELHDVPALTAIGLISRINKYRAAMVEGVVCVGTKEDISQLKGGGQFALYQLKHAKSADIASIVAKIYKDVEVIEDPRTNSIIITGSKK